jgi:mannose-P-dolichol utilization defect protein 1
MPDPKFVLLVIREDCWNPFFVDFTWLSPAAWGAGLPLRECVSTSISKSLGYGIIAGSSVVKIPQVLNVISSRSGDGLSLDSQVMEFVSNALAVVYYALYEKSPFSAYGETIIVALGCLLVICAMIYFAKKDRAEGIVRLVLSVAAVAAFIPSVFDPLVKYAPVAVNAGIVVLFLAQLAFWVARITQIIDTEKTKSNGAQSSITLVANLLGTTARIFTSMKEVNNKYQLGCTVFNAGLNAVLLWQFWRFSRPATTAVGSGAASAKARRASTKGASTKVKAP